MSLYIKTFADSFLLPVVEEQLGDSDFMFQHDLAPVHAARSTAIWFQAKKIPVLNWPVNSSELRLCGTLSRVSFRTTSLPLWPSWRQFSLLAIDDVWGLSTLGGLNCSCHYCQRCPYEILTLRTKGPTHGELVRDRKCSFAVNNKS